MSVLLALGWPAVAGSIDRDAAAPELSITVCVYNYAGVPARTMRPAREKATEVFRQAGIEVDWVDCLAPVPDPEPGQASRSRIGPSWISPGLLPRSMTKRYEPPHGVFGRDLPGPNGESGR
ncbi:MAG: hypothetical protein GY953_33585, partial [bacterium]|nr:hypothetical protein [bacterium]